MNRRRLGWVVALWASSVVAAEPAGLGLDLSPPRSLNGVLVLPPVTTVVTGKKGAFVGVDTRKTVDRFLLPAHEKLVAAFGRRLAGKVLPADVVLGMLNKEGVGPGSLDKAPVLAQLAKVAGVEWGVTFTLSKTAVLTATLFDIEGKPAGENSILGDVSSLTDEQADAMAGLVVPRVLAAQKARADAEAARKPVVVVAPPPPPDEDLDAEAERLKVKQAQAGRAIDRGRVRALVAVGPGATLRDLALSGETAGALADLENGVIVGLGVGAQVMPLEFFEATSGRPWSQLSVEVHYRRAFVRAQGVGGGLEGTACTMTDDDLQLRVGVRYRLGEGYLPTIGLAGGWSQEQTRFDCSLPLVSTTWRGVDAQVRVRQPLFREFVTLELIGGPRVLLPGPLAASPGFSLSAEAWLEVKPMSVLFARAGARFSRLQAANPTLGAIDTRTFLALELGAFF